MSIEQFRPTGFKVLPDVVKNLLIINGIFFFATLILGNRGFDLTDLLGLHYFTSSKFYPHQLITYMFMHGGFAHIALNMLALWMFGAAIENIWGGKKFLIFYIFCGFGAAITHLLYTYYTLIPFHNFLDHPTIEGYQRLFDANRMFFVSEAESIQFISEWMKNAGDSSFTAQAVANAEGLMSLKANIPVVGASGSVFGLLLAFGMLFPNSIIYLYFAIPVKAKYFVIGYGLVELFSGVANKAGDNVAHFAHLGGLLSGLLLMLFWRYQKYRRNKYFH